jgi:dipeptidyl aminopeptidase/acylaminoacyl peptidase/tetratricopeptide (TPR) repeat protein
MKKYALYLSILFLCFSFINASIGYSEKNETPAFKEVLSLKSPGSSIISPDARYVVYTVTETDWEKNEYKTQLWLANISTGEKFQLTYSDKSSSNPQWSPDSKFISFTSARDEKTQIYIMAVAGGEARQLTESKTNISDYRWSPDGKWIAYTAPDEKSKREEAVEKKYGKFEVVDEKFNVNHLWLVEVESGKTEKLVDKDTMHIGSFDWSPDGSMIAYDAMPDNRAESWSKSDIYIVEIAPKTIRTLVEQAGPDSSPLWSPDGKTIAFSTKMGREDFFTNYCICTTPIEGGAITCLTRDFDEDAYPETWKQDGIYFFAQKGMSGHLFKIDLATRKITQITKQDGLVFMGGSYSQDGRKMACTFGDAAHYPEVYYSEMRNFAPQKLTEFGEQLKDWKLSTKETIKWKSKDGAEITGVLIKPIDFDAKKKYPLLVIIHGGPTAISVPQYLDRYNRYYPMEQWVAKGAVILEPNYRGSTGFGEAFRKLNYRNLGVGDYWDVISGVDYLVSQGFIDNDRLGAMGWSQGGYISAFITTYSDRFKAVSVGAGISDWVTYYVNTDIHPFTRSYLGATPWDDEEIYKKTSPMTYINNAKTPTLIQHGEFDQRVPIPNAFKLYQGLQDKGVPVKFVIYKGFGHGITKPKENLACLKHNWEWFNKYIWGEEPEEETFEDEKEGEPEVISLLGKKLYANPAEGDDLKKLENDFKEAREKFEADAENPENIILYGRRAAYLWKYNKAIDIYTKGIEKFPDNAMLYRHRGHRYISIRKFDQAVEDLAKAAQLNDHDFDIWYHLGLAYYLKGEFDKALEAYQNCLKTAEDDDSLIAISNWLYITLRRSGKKDETNEVLERIKVKGMNVVENQSYYNLLLFYKGIMSEEEIMKQAEKSDLELATCGYGIGCWYLYNNGPQKAKSIFEKVVNHCKYWPAFGYIAAEVECARMES